MSKNETPFQKWQREDRKRNRMKWKDVEWDMLLFLALWWGVYPYLFYLMLMESSLPDADKWQFLGVISFVGGLVLTMVTFCAIGWVIDKIEHFKRRHDPYFVAFERSKRGKK